MARQPSKTKFDPIATLRKIAADPKAGSTARVQACKALLQFKDVDAVVKDNAPSDAVTRRALRLLRGGKS